MRNLCAQLSWLRRRGISIHLLYLYIRPRRAINRLVFLSTTTPTAISLSIYWRRYRIRNSVLGLPSLKEEEGNSCQNGKQTYSNTDSNASFRATAQPTVQ